MIFASEAPKYYAKGMSVIPLREREKRPFTNAWQQWAENPIPKELQDEWIEDHPNGNIGLVLGKQSGVVVIDVDVDDSAIITAIEALLPQSPWKRVGAKGYVAAFKFNGTPTFRIKDYAGKTIVEHLSTRTQVVLPPSIHPDTGQAYTANCDLVDVVDQLPTLNPQIEEMLRGALQDHDVKLSVSGYTKMAEYVPQGARDVHMVKVAGSLVTQIMRGEINFKRAIDDLVGWAATRVENVVGDELDIEKGIRKLAEFLRREVYEKKKILPRGWDEGLVDSDKKDLGLEFGMDNQEWSYEELQDHIRRGFEDANGSQVKQQRIIEDVLQRLATSKTMTHVTKDAIIQQLRDSYGNGLTLQSVRRQMAEYARGPIEGENHAELARAIIEDYQKVAPIRFHDAQFWRWNGSHWEELTDQEILKTIAEDYGNLNAARKSNDHRGILNTIANMCEQGIQKIDGVSCVNFANGVLTEEGELRKHDPDFGFTYTLPFRYRKDTAHTCDRFMQFLHDSWGDDSDIKQKIDALQEAMAATLFGLGPTYQKAILLLGVPKAGKSQLLEIVQALVPDGARSSIPPEKWGDRFAPASMQYSLLNYAGELAEDKYINEEVFKSIISGEEMFVEYKGKQGFTMRSKAMHWFGSNHLPRTKSGSESVSRRWLVLTFNKPATQDKIVPNLGKSIVAQEREAIVAWAVEGLARLRKQKGYTVPESHIDMIDEIGNLNNSVRYFILGSGWVNLDGTKTCSPIYESELYNEYSNFCILGAVAKRVSPAIFAMRLRELCQTRGMTLEKVRNPKTGLKDTLYHGITLAGERAKK